MKSQYHIYNLCYKIGENLICAIISVLLCNLRCNSLIGRSLQLQGQAVTLSAQCLKHRGEILHELTHLIGLHHEHQRPDRDQYIEVLYDNIIPRYKYLFTKLDFNTFGLQYDFGSIVHVRHDSFVKENHNYSIRVLNSSINTSTIGLQHCLSRTDYKKINTMYSCDRGKTLAS